MAKDKKSLGTGLDILFGSADFADDEDSELLTVPLNKVEPRKDQPRYHFDEAALQELADSIATYGLIQPIVVRKLGSNYQIIAGERRWRASRIAGLSEVPVRVIEADDRRTAELALVENLQRENLNPMEEAQGYQTLIEDYGLTQEEAAKSVGKSRPAITNALRLLSLSPAVTKMVEAGTLSAGHARALLSITDEKKQLEAANEVVRKNLSVRKTEKLASDYGKEVKKVTDDPDTVHVDYAAEMSASLSKLLGRMVKVKEARKGGHIELEYYDSDDREALIQKLQNLNNH